MHIIMNMNHKLNDYNSTAAGCANGNKKRKLSKLYHFKATIILVVKSLQMLRKRILLHQAVS